MTPVGFTWIRVSPSDDAEGIHSGMYVLLAEVVAYLREYDADTVRDLLEALEASNPPATTGGWVGLA